MQIKYQHTIMTWYFDLNALNFTHNRFVILDQAAVGDPGNAVLKLFAFGENNTYLI